MSHSFLTLLFQSEDTIIRDSKMRSNILDFFEFILENLSKAIYLFHVKKKYELFDPHIGDTACQIRACFLYELSNYNNAGYSATDRISKIDNLYKVLLKYKENTDINQEKNNHQNIRELAEQIGISLAIVEEEKIIFQSYFLTHYKIETETDTILIEHNKISQRLNISNKASKKLTRSYQLSIASYSCNKIFKWANSVQSADLKILKKLKRIDDDGREVLPCYLFNKVIYNYALKTRVPLCVIAKLENKIFTFYFEANEDSSAYILRSDLKNIFNKPCIIITGHSSGSSKNYYSKILLTGIKNILLSAMAAHPQYTGKKLSPFCENIFNECSAEDTHESISQEIDYMRFLAGVLGCSHENQSLFVVNHIFLGTIPNQSVFFGLKLKEQAAITSSL